MEDAKIKSTLDLITNWWDTLTPVKQNNNLPAKGTVSGALVILNNLKEEYILNLDQHRASRGRSQIKGLGQASVQKILATFGEMRVFSKEGGRTNRGGPGELEKLLETLRNANLKSLPKEKRNEVLVEIQRFLVGKVGEYFSRERIKVDFDPNVSAWQTVHDMLESSNKVGKGGPFSQYLVGAKLAIRFPSANIRNDIASAQDQQSGSPGDFLIGDTVFHVTIAPNMGHFEKCRDNVKKGYSVFLLVPDSILYGARNSVENLIPGRVTTQSIESFISQNIEELSSFTKGRLIGDFRKLLEAYNERVERVDPDKSMLIEIPRTLYK